MRILQWRSGAFALVSLASACTSSSGSSHPAVDPDANVVTVTTTSRPALIAFRDDLSTDWIGVPVQGATTFDLTTHGAYQVVVACNSGDQDPNVTIVLYGRTADDDPRIKISCTGVVPFEVRGTMLQASEVGLGNTGEGASFGNWEFRLQEPPGTFDLVLTSLSSAGVPSSIAFRRDLAILNDVDLGTIDLTQEASQPLVPVSYTIANLQPGESSTAGMVLTAGNTRASMSTLGPTLPGMTLQLAPDSALRPTDSQRVTLSASIRDSTTSLSHARSLSRNVRVGDPTAWTLPDHDEVELLRESIVFPTDPSVGLRFRLHEMLLSRFFLEATGATSATLDLHAIPGFQSQWQLDPADSQFREFVVLDHVSATETASSSVGGSTSASSSRAEPPPVEPGARQRTWFAPGQPDHAWTAPLRSAGLAGRP